MSVEWMAPPVAHTGRGRAVMFDATVEQLKERPGEWARVQRRMATRGEPFKERGCQVTTVIVQTKPLRQDIYARWPEDS